MLEISLIISLIFLGDVTFNFVKGIIKPFIKIRNIKKIKNNILSSNDIKMIKEKCITARSKQQRNNLIDTENKQDLFYYKENLKQELNSEQQKLLNINFKSLRYKYINNRKYLFLGAKGYYNSKTNKLVVGSDKRAATHELVHLATGCYSKENRIIITGFKQTQLTRIGTIKSNIGSAINEAFTNINDCRTFDKDMLYFYKQQTIVALLLEQILNDKEKIKTDFYNMDLNNLLQEFKQIGMEDELLRIIILLDATLDMDIGLASYYFVYKTIKELIYMFENTNPTLKKREEFFDIISNDIMLKKYVQKKKIYNYKDNDKNKENAILLKK